MLFRQKHLLSLGYLFQGKGLSHNRLHALKLKRLQPLDRTTSVFCFQRCLTPAIVPPKVNLNKDQVLR
jgi:hypothetical protein